MSLVVRWKVCRLDCVASVLIPGGLRDGSLTVGGDERKWGRQPDSLAFAPATRQWTRPNPPHAPAKVLIAATLVLSALRSSVSKLITFDFGRVLVAPDRHVGCVIRRRLSAHFRHGRGSGFLVAVLLEQSFRKVIRSSLSLPAA